MGCKECEVSQTVPASAFFRWGRANVGMRGCDHHLREIFDVLRSHQTSNCEGKVGLLLRPESWVNLFECIRKSSINSKGNFWAAVQELERQAEGINNQALPEK